MVRATGICNNLPTLPTGTRGHRLLLLCAAFAAAFAAAAFAAAFAAADR